MDENRSDGLFILWRSHDRALRGLEGAGFCHQQVPNFEIQLRIGGDPEIDLSLIEMKPAHLVKRKEAVLSHLYMTIISQNNGGYPLFGLYLNSLKDREVGRLHFFPDILPGFKIYVSF